MENQPQNTNLEKEITWENTIFPGNTINFNGEKKTIKEVRDKGHYYDVVFTDGSYIGGGIGKKEAEDSAILYQNGKK